MKHLEFDT